MWCLGSMDMATVWVRLTWHPQLALPRGKPWPQCGIFPHGSVYGSTFQASEPLTHSPCLSPKPPLSSVLLCVQESLLLPIFPRATHLYCKCHLWQLALGSDTGTERWHPKSTCVLVRMGNREWGSTWNSLSQSEHGWGILICLWCQACQQYSQ